MVGRAVVSAHHPLHTRRAIASAAKSVVLFVVLPLVLIYVYQLMAASNGLPVSPNLSSASVDIAYIGISVAVVSVIATLLGNERWSGLSLRALAQFLAALYALYLLGRRYSFIVDGQVSVAFSIFPLAAATAVIAMLRVVPAVLEHFETKG